MRGEVLGSERRRLWSDDAKLAIVSWIGIDGATATQMAQHDKVTRRHDLREKGLWSVDTGTIFGPIDRSAIEPPSPAAEPVVFARLQLRLTGRRYLRFHSALYTPVLIRLIQAVETA